MSNNKNFRKNQESHNKPGELVIRPLEVVVRGNDFESAFRLFKSLVQKDGILAEVKARRAYEKPSVKKRRKKREARERRLAAEAKAKLIASGEWEKRQKKRAQQKQKNLEQKAKKNEAAKQEA